jgi:ABC-type molybdate transport system substrate-binding protein
MSENVDVVYAGSLAGFMHNVVAPGFERATGIRFAGRDGFGGAVGIAEAIRSGRIAPDVFLAADGTQVMRLLTAPPDRWAAWYVPLRAVRVLAYSPHSAWRADFERLARGEVRWARSCVGQARGSVGRIRTSIRVAI